MKGQAAMTQNQMVLNFLSTGRTITSLEALDMFGCFRLPSRINELKKLGHSIESQLVERNGKWVAKYFMVPK